MEVEQGLFRLFGKFCPEGTILFTEGSSGEGMYVVQSGRLQLGPGRPEGRSELGPGDIVGEEAFFQRTTRPMRAVIVQEARLLEVNDRSLDVLARHGPETTGAALERLVELGARARREVEAWGLAHLLRRAEPALRRAEVAVVSAEELAEEAGLAAADAADLLEKLERLGVAVRAGKGYRVPDPSRLASAARGLAGLAGVPGAP